ncbi:MAG: hypothetical protein LIR50_05740 [Bacillota bacterium]|nr:hypothetical protein [Bacillota bacterium]
MKNKTMTIHQFLQMCRVKEFNPKRSHKRFYILVVLFIVLGFATIIRGELTPTDSATAFQLNNINFLR